MRTLASRWQAKTVVPACHVVASAKTGALAKADLFDLSNANAASYDYVFSVIVL